MSANGARKRRPSEVDDEEAAEPSTCSPTVIHDFCKHLLGLEQNGDITLKNKTGRTTFSQLVAGQMADGFEDVDLNEVQKSFRDYYRKASNLSRVPLKMALEQVMMFADAPKAVEMHPDFPQRPPGKFALFCQMKGTWFANISESDKQQFHDKNDKTTQKVEREQEKQQKAYIDKLKEFLASYRNDLRPSHVEHVSRMIKRYEKQFKDPSESTPKKRGKKEPKKQLTAFEFYKRTKKDKYLELEAEDREAKLLRHFNKLEPDKRTIFEELAANQDDDD